MNHAKTVFVLSVIAVVGLSALLLLRDGDRTAGDVELTIHCAAGLRKPVEEIIAEYQRQYGVTIRANYGPSGALQSQIKAGQGGDIYLPADASYVEAMRKDGLAREAIPVAQLTAGIAVRKGNPKKVQDLAGLSKAGVKVSLANVEAAVGKFTRKVLVQSGHWDAISKGEIVFKPTVNAVAEDVALGSVDAAIAWDAVIKQFDELDFVSVPEFDRRTKHSTVCLLNSSPAPREALRFMRYLAARDRGQKIFRENHFVTGEGDAWSVHRRFVSTQVPC